MVFNSIPVTHFSVFADTTPTLVCRVTDKSNQPIDLTGWDVTVTMFASESPGAAEVWSHIATNGSTDEVGIARLKLTANDTAWLGKSSAKESRHSFVIEVSNSTDSYIVSEGVMTVKRGRA